MATSHGQGVIRSRSSVGVFVEALHATSEFDLKPIRTLVIPHYPRDTVPIR